MSVYPTVHGEVFIDGEWVSFDKTNGDSAIRGNNSSITIQRGRPNERAAIIPTSANFTISDPDGRYSDRNPRSPYFGLLGKNTPFRARVDEATGDGWLFLHNRTNSRAQALTLDTASLDITGDIDIRVDCDPHSWRPDGLRTIISKSKADSAISWTLYYNEDGQLRFISSSDSTTRIFYSPDYRIPATARRLTIRVTLDVNNGSGGKTCTFYIGTEGVNGSFTQVEQEVSSGTTSIHSGSADVIIGGLDAGTTNSYIGPGRGFQGKIYAAQIRNGIGGTIVANPDFTSANIDETTITDSTGKEWLILSDMVGDARLSNDGVRFYGEIPQWPVEWDNTGSDVRKSLQASGILRRLQKYDVVKSTLYRKIAASSPIAWWSFEAQQSAFSTGGISQVFADAGGKSAMLTNCEFVDTGTLFGSGGAVQITDSTSSLAANIPTFTNTGAWSVLWLIKSPIVPSTFTIPVTIIANGSARKWQIQYDPGGINVFARGPGDELLDSGLSLWGGFDVTEWGAFRLQVSESSGTVSWELKAYPLNGEVLYTFASGSFSGSAGIPKQFQSSGSQTDIPGTAFTHIHVKNSTFTMTTTFVNAMNAYAGPYSDETAVERMERLCAEEGIPFHYLGDYSSETVQNMGPQQVGKLLDLLEDVVKIDGGILLEQRDYSGLLYITRNYMYANSPLQLDYSLSHLSLPLRPSDSDSNLRNDITVTRRDGGYYRSQQETGPNNVQDPGVDADAVGRYPDAVMVNADNLPQIIRLAQWLKALGTADRERYEAICVELHRSVFATDSTLTSSVAERDIGGWLELTSLPAFLPADDVPVIIQFYTEVITNKTWTITWVSSPADPWLAAVYDDEGDIENGNDNGTRYNSAYTSVNSSFVAGTDTSLSIKIDSGKKLWITGSSAPVFPLDLVVGGVRLRATAISGATSPQTVTVEQQPINGVAKTIPANTPVRLYRGRRWAF